MMGALTSRSVFLNNVMAAVKDPNIRVIRICGMGGTGKTTIAKSVEQRATAEHLFHEIAMVEVNQNPDLTILQLHIAKRLCKRLILLIPDHVWKKEDLEEAGIPGEKSLCKILLTSRSDLVWKDMALEPEFNPHPENDRMMAEELVKECGGLPISSTAIAGAVAYKSKQSWTDALRKLQKSDFKGSDVPIEDLARYGMALGCFSDPNKLYDARNEAYSYADISRIQTYCYAVTSQGVFKSMTLYGILLCQFHLMICLS